MRHDAGRRVNYLQPNLNTQYPSTIVAIAKTQESR